MDIVEFLRNYVRIATCHPKPDYSVPIKFLSEIADKDGFSYQIVTLASHLPMFLLTYPGSDPHLPAIALNHHMDVVPANKEGWICDPFEGTLRDGLIIGRGTEDMKSIGAMHYFALRELKLSGWKPKRTIYLFGVPEEEVGGFGGTALFVQTELFKSLNLGYVIDEGHSSGDPQCLDLKISERKPIQIEIISKGELAHGSHLLCDNGLHTLVRFLGDYTNLHQENQKRARTDGKAPGEFVSYNVTSLSAGVKKPNSDSVALNVVPAEAKATMDIRVPPSVKNAEVIARLDSDIAKYGSGLSYKILAQATEEPGPEAMTKRTPLYLALADSIKKSSGLDTKPHYFEASSDLRFYLARGIDGVGCTPLTIKDNIHGVNECVPIDQLLRGKNIVVHFLKDFCS